MLHHEDVRRLDVLEGRTNSETEAMARFQLEDLQARGARPRSESRFVLLVLRRRLFVDDSRPILRLRVHDAVTVLSAVAVANDDEVAAQDAVRELHARDHLVDEVRRGVPADRRRREDDSELLAQEAALATARLPFHLGLLSETSAASGRCLDAPAVACAVIARPLKMRRLRRIFAASITAARLRGAFVVTWASSSSLRDPMAATAAVAWRTGEVFCVGLHGRANPLKGACPGCDACAALLEPSENADQCKRDRRPKHCGRPQRIPP
mmetsp:Transcript_79883/g.222463  ORF Transcript_79883/g.222463 Transcript_79883/m.222463 type:complete len:267 (+) Transcript_79883:530-1330(+)